MNELHFFSPYAEIKQTQNRLPHWQQAGAVYFVTFRLADAVPMRLRNQWEDERETWLRTHPEPWSAKVEREYHQRFSGTIEQWLDAGHGACLLRSAGCAQIVADTLLHFEGERVVMVRLPLCRIMSMPCSFKIRNIRWRNYFKAGNDSRLAK